MIIKFVTTIILTFFIALNLSFSQTENKESENKQNQGTAKQKEDTTFVQVYTNPVSAEAYVVVNSAGFKNLYVDVYNILGKKIASLFAQNVNGNYFTTIPMNEFPNGIYIYKIKVDNRLYVRRLTLVRD